MKLSHILMLSATALFSLAACDTIDESERFEGPFGGGGDSEIVTVKKNVLIEDFTGQKCINCPLAHKEIEELHDAYGADRVIAVALHGGPQAVEGKKGLANEESKEYNNRLNIPAWPMGRIDRQGGLQDFEKWLAGVAGRIDLSAKADIALQHVAYDADARQISFEAQVKGFDVLDGNLQVWLTESQIVAPQDMPSGKPELFPDFPNGGRDKNYVHNHVFRATVNGMDGDALHLDKDQTVTKAYTYTLPAGATWNAEHMALVVFYYNASGVQQVVEVPVVKK